MVNVEEDSEDVDKDDRVSSGSDSDDPYEGGGGGDGTADARNGYFTAYKALSGYDAAIAEEAVRGGVHPLPSTRLAAVVRRHKLRT